MTALKILDTKKIMTYLLSGTMFDRFLVEECSITTYNTFHIDGRIRKEFYPAEEASMLPDSAFSAWTDIKPFCFQLIKGKNTPLNFKFVFHLSSEDMLAFLKETTLSFSPTDINALVITLKYDGTSITCTTGTSLFLFTLDKSLDTSWDRYISDFFLHNEINFEAL